MKSSSCWKVTWGLGRLLFCFVLREVDRYLKVGGNNVVKTIKNDAGDKQNLQTCLARLIKKKRNRTHINKYKMKKEKKT